MNRFEFYKELYFREIERQEFLNNSINTILSILSGLVVGVFVLATTFSYESSVFSSYAFIITITIALIPIITSGSFLAFAFVHKKGMFRFSGPFEYKVLAMTGDLLAWQKSLDKYFAALPEATDNFGKLSDKEFEYQLIEQFSQFTDINIKSNDAKSSNIYNAKKFLIYSIIISFFTVFPYGYSLYKKPKIAYKLNVSERDSKKTREKLNQFTNQPMPDQTQNIPPSPLPKPETNRPPVPPPPPGRLIKEGERPSPKTKE